MSANDNVRRLLATIGQLSRLLREENQRLGAGGPVKGLKDIVAEKEALSRVYENQLKAVNDPETVEKLEPELRTRMKEAAQSLAQLMEENSAKLQAKIEVTKHVFRIIAEAAQEYSNGTTVYGRDGAVGRRAGQAYRPAVSVGVNREL